MKRSLLKIVAWTLLVLPLAGCYTIDGYGYGYEGYQPGGWSWPGYSHRYIGWGHVPGRRLYHHKRYQQLHRPHGAKRVWHAGRAYRHGKRTRHMRRAGSGNRWTRHGMKHARQGHHREHGHRR